MEATMETLAGRLGITIIVIGLEVPGFPVAQLKPDMSVQMTTSPLAGIYEYVGSVPTENPFTIH